MVLPLLAGALALPLIFWDGAAPPADFASREQVPEPHIEVSASVASATRSPWITANGYRYLWRPKGRYFCDAPPGTGALAMAEAFAYQADVAVKIDPEERPAVERLRAMLAAMPRETGETVGDLIVVDDGAEELEEICNLMSRKNLLYRVAKAPDPRARINIRVGSKECPKDLAGDPEKFSLRMRERLGQGRLLRIWGAETVLGRVTRQGRGLRVHLLHYGNGTLEGIRLRVRGNFNGGRLWAAEFPDARLDGGVEFYLPAIAAYAAIDLE
jgi:hypothetical protein